MKQYNIFGKIDKIEVVENEYKIKTYNMNYKQSTGKSIDRAFTEYHEENPQVFEMFKKYINEIIASEVKKRGFTSYDMVKERKTLKTSSKMILNRIRWEIATVGIQNTNSEQNASERVFDSFKINDAFTSRYARLFCDQNPDWAFMFNLRSLRS